MFSGPGAGEASGNSKIVVVCESIKKRNVQPELLLVPETLPPGINHLQYVLSGVRRCANPNPIQKDFFRCQHLVSFETPAHAEKRAKNKDKTAEKNLVD
jgi:hypothetical protein